MLVAIEGCAHGELGHIYSTLLAAPTPPQLLICCGDFQSVRNGGDLAALAAPAKHRRAGDFYRYYNGELKAPILTIFIGGNHEASNYLQELTYGGWVAPNIYYLGNAGVITVSGIRIAGLSGIYKGHDYLKGHFEVSPYTESTKRSVYHIRNLETFRLKQLSGKINMCLSHDWPQGIVYHGDIDHLLKIKPYFREDIDRGQLGSPPCEELLYNLRPEYWFAAHMHCHFAAIVPHTKTKTHTKFLALDKCLPHRKFLQIIEFPHDEDSPIEIKYDLEWLTILRLTNHLLSVRYTLCHMPGENGDERYNFTPTEEEKNETLKMMNDNLVVSTNFVMTAKSFVGDPRSFQEERQTLPPLNTQTTKFCELLKIDDPISLIALQNGSVLIPYIPSESNSPSAQPAESEPLDDEESDDLTTPPPNIITSMNLPTPRLSIAEGNEEIDITIDDISTDPSLETSNLTETSLIIEEESDMNPSSEETSVSPKKTFKRRNESLYKSYSADDN